jgi:hypothetical protein
MKKIISFPKLLRLFAISVFVFLCIWIYMFDPLIENIRRFPTGLSDFRKIEYYAIDSYTTLESLDQDLNNVFISSTNVPDEPIYNEKIEWQQSDYVEIADTVGSFIWENTFEDWDIYYLSFNALCQDNLNGFSLGDFYYFKQVFLNNGKIRYSAREIQILPEYGRVILGNGANFLHPLLGWKSINLGDIKISAENAFRIADENGGQDARRSVENDCTIQVRLSGYDNYWKVRISKNNTASVIFIMTINPYTGEIK